MYARYENIVIETTRPIEIIYVYESHRRTFAFINLPNK